MVGGVLDLKDIEGVEVEINLIPLSNKKARPRNMMVPIGITVHETANERVGADARMHGNYLKSIDEYKSWHFTVDDKRIVQHLPINENAWASGDGRGDGNMRTIHVEICVNKDGDYEKAKHNAIKLIRFLKTLFGGLDNLYTHKYWSGKDCPKRILSDGWERFVSMVDYEEALQNDWKQQGLNWLKDSRNIDPPVMDNWKKTDVVDMGTLGVILSRLNKG